jgi:hypothetical protein
MPRPLQILIALQAADFLTTARVLHLGGFEGNPLVAGAMTLGPLVGLLLAKLIVIAIGVSCVHYGHRNAVVIANYLYCAVIAWNCLCLAVGA